MVRVEPSASRGGNRGPAGMLCVVFAGVIAVGASVGGAAADPPASAPGAKRALVRALAAVTAAPPAAVPPVAPPGRADPTLALHRLALAYPRLRGADRRRARALLQRPPLGEYSGAEQQLGSGWTVPEAAASPACTPHFCVHFVDSSADAPPPADSDGQADGDGVPDYVESVRRVVERAFAVENDQLGWRRPKPDGGRGGSPKVDVYLAQIGNIGLFGYANTDPGQGSAGNRKFSYLVLDDDYVEFAPLKPAAALKVTVAHEYNHILQFGIDFHQQLWMFEASATYMEELVYPQVSDWLRYVPAFAANPELPMTRPGAGRGLKIYGDAVFNHWLDRGAGFGPAVVRDAWEASPHAEPRHFAPAAYDRSIREHGGDGFAHEFARFSASSAEWRAGSDFPDAKRLPHLRRFGRLKAGTGRRVRLDHTAFELFNVRARHAQRIVLSVKARRGVRSAIALVARKGSATRGRVERHLDYLPHGGAGKVRLRRPGSFRRVTAVVTNSDGRSRGRNRLGSRAFRSDGAGFRLRLITDRSALAGACRCRH